MDSLTIEVAQLVFDIFCRPKPPYYPADEKNDLATRHKRKIIEDIADGGIQTLNHSGLSGLVKPKH